MKSVTVSDIGKTRETNEDSFFRSDSPVGVFPCLYIVADGMGGYNAGDYASDFCVEEFVRIAESKKGRIIKVFDEALTAVNRSLYQESISDEDKRGMGTTFVGLTIKGEKATIANVGDSRAYILKEDELIQISKDHSVVAKMMENGQLSNKEAKVHPRKNVLLKAVGVESELIPDIFELKVSRGDLFLLCTDGLTGMLDDEEIYTILTEESDADIKDRAIKLVEKALEKGGTDNITVLLVLI